MQIDEPVTTQSEEKEQYWKDRKSRKKIEQGIRRTTEEEESEENKVELEEFRLKRGCMREDLKKCCSEKCTRISFAFHSDISTKGLQLITYQKKEIL